ncbi:ABC transporter permease [Candidatus Cryosericum septentrionale]|uniref:ABC transporter permease n=2 Tax=Candidatus Cryosericum septentrionale TaxID=2290913 RepID=A0A398DL71_9BACT|nr:ABC transporter permease [Candidatus Cryosericum septentrionale]
MIDTPYRRLASTLGGLIRNPLSAIGLSLVVLFVVIAVFAPQVAPQDPIALDPVHRLLPPGIHHLFGTDENGRDILSRVIVGTRLSLLGAAGILMIGVVIGVPIGLLAGYAGKWIDEILMRVTDIFLSFPSLVFAIAVAATLGPSIRNAVIATGVVWWPWYARLIRGEVLKLKHQSFVEGAKILGAGSLRIMFLHILRNSLTPLIVQVSLDFGYAVLTLASLSFLGLGAQPPTPEWGEMISAGQSYYLTQWWYVTFPGLTILVAVMAFNLLGDGLREVLSLGRAR